MGCGERAIAAQVSWGCGWVSVAVLLAGHGRVSGRWPGGKHSDLGYPDGDTPQTISGRQRWLSRLQGRTGPQWENAGDVRTGRPRAVVGRSLSEFARGSR